MWLTNQGRWTRVTRQRAVGCGSRAPLPIGSRWSLIPDDCTVPGTGVVPKYHRPCCSLDCLSHKAPTIVEPVWSPASGPQETGHGCLARPGGQRETWSAASHCIPSPNTAGPPSSRTPCISKNWADVLLSWAFFLSIVRIDKVFSNDETIIGMRCHHTYLTLIYVFTQIAYHLIS